MIRRGRATATSRLFVLARRRGIPLPSLAVACPLTTSRQYAQSLGYRASRTMIPQLARSRPATWMPAKA